MLGEIENSRFLGKHVSVIFLCESDVTDTYTFELWFY